MAVPASSTTARKSTMRARFVVSSVFLTSAVVFAACSSDSTSIKDVATDSGTPDAGPTETLYTRLGERNGIQSVIDDFLGRVLADAKINGYFLNATVDSERLSRCLVEQVSQATGGPDEYSCRSMKDAHAGLGISKVDFDDLVGHLSAALVEKGVDPKDIDTILGVLGPMSADIVEDDGNDKTIYQRVGRKPAIQAVVADFESRVAADTTINSFFAKRDLERIGACLVRQVCGATGGPCRYGEEISNAEPAIGESACRSMKETHTGLGIAKADFDALAGHFVDALQEAKVAEADVTAIGGVLGGLCTQIVEKDPKACE
jgi:truncated hemoglobin YjbI